MSSRSLRRALVLGLLLAAAVPAQAMAERYETPPDTTSGLVPPSVDNPSPPPKVEGSPQVGGTLNGDRGTWESGTSLTSRWLRCNPGAALNPTADLCVATGDTDLTYAVTAADQGSVMLLRVEGTRSELTGSRTRTADAVSNPIAAAPAGPVAPRNVVAPRITGNAREGQLLGVALGQWVGTDPISYSYLWASCARNAACRTVATSASYRAKLADVGKGLRLTVTARNLAGAATATMSTGAVTPKSAISSLKRLSPFPTMLIDGRVAGRITRISTLRLRRVPGGSTVNMTCKGRGCPFRKSRVKVRKGKSRTVVLRRLQRRMRAGTVVVVTVRKGNTLGKYIRLRFRRSVAPSRVDRCVAPKSSKPIKCT